MVCMNIHMSRNCVIRNLTCMNHHAKKSKKRVMVVWSWSSGELCGPWASWFFLPLSLGDSSILTEILSLRVV